ncbi:hypothetical protein C8Q74DRAFT_1224580 [Fomes fomentarius]|nr:hypothetical protein C8Q74DRAFT_1224580 [Fomes fomentarius]
MRGTGHLREQTTRPDLLRLTRHALQVAELLPWPVKGVLYHVNPRLTARVTQVTKFSGGDGLEPAHRRLDPLGL